MPSTQSDLSLRWAHMPFSWFCHEVAHIKLFVLVRCGRLTSWYRNDLETLKYYYRHLCYPSYMYWYFSFHHVGVQFPLSEANLLKKSKCSRKIVWLSQCPPYKGLAGIIAQADFADSNVTTQCFDGFVSSMPQKKFQAL